LILDEMRTAIKKALNKDTADSKTNIDDGMDMSIVILPPSNDKLLFSGANQSVILISGGEAIRLKGDANPIGNYVREKEHFETTEQSVNSGDAVYLFSDGIQDQTGGDNERKYSFKRLMDFLYEHHTLPMKQQMALFEQDIDSYTGESPQVDDRTLVGIRI
ncbi:MAG: SpoIIE family protein phosphatase, partial [Bacteroidales bacterium]|nr:SpoIIE family protein phosphatase [Bacteroidales bacterium]